MQERKYELMALFVALFLGAGALLAQGETPAGVVNINTAGVDELTLLPRIGPTTAGRIVDYREENGPFQQPEELMLVQGIGERTYEILAPYVTLEGDTTLTERVSPPRAASRNDSQQE